MLPQKRILLITGVTDFLEIRRDGYERKKAGSIRASFFSHDHCAVALNVNSSSSSCVESSVIQFSLWII
ncbi:hypothetical protein ETA10_19060 [Bacillus subtilis]|nr:hypothetical protein [Bacillus subtilis]NOV05709.1 hypothetical protein [Bacillus sp. seq1]QAW14086.1 hypothetical protein ETA10_19060 [Bacillus subtilis]